MDAKNYKKMEKFIGINNVESAFHLSPAMIDYKLYHSVQEANNFEIDNSFSPKTRTGFTSILSGANIHSLWSDGEKGFFADGNILYELDLAYNKTIIGNVGVDFHISFVTVNDRVYYTNGYEIAYVKESQKNQLMTPQREFKLPLPAGSHIEFFKGCLYVSVNNILYVSDPLCDYYDTRRGYIIFNHDINMICAVDEGIYVSDKKVWFLKGRGIDDFEKIEADSNQAIQFTDVKISPEDVDKDGPGVIAMWTSLSGISYGDNRGVVKNITENRYKINEYGNGAALVRNKKNVKHYINALY